MKKIWLLALIILALHSILAAQKLTDRKEIGLALNKDSSYKKFRQQLIKLRKVVRGNETNFTAVKALFASNRTMLTNLYKKSNISPVKYTVKTPVKPPRFELKPKLQMAERPGGSQVPPYDDHWIGREWDQVPSLNDYQSDANIGKLGYTYYIREDDFQALRGASVGFKQTIRIPSDPDIIAARVEFQYSFHFTGWDTRDANFRLGIMLQCVNFTSPSFLSLPSADYMQMDPHDKWRRVKELTPEINITEDVREFLYDEDSSFVIEGNVIPGRDMVFRFGPGYRQGDTEGIYDCYHYGEFRLKMIKVSYMKAQ